MNSPRFLNTTLLLAVVSVVVLSPGASATPSSTMAPPRRAQACVSLGSPAGIPAPGLLQFDDLYAVIGDHYRPTHGVRFEDIADNRAVTYSAEPEEAHSPPNVVINNAVWPNTSRNVPLTIWFDEAKTHVGMYIGNGGGEGMTGVLTAYDASDLVLCQASAGPVPEPRDLFIGLHDASGRIRKVTLDYGDTLIAESIDDLHFAPYTPAAPTATSTAASSPTPSSTATPTRTEQACPTLASPAGIPSPGLIQFDDGHSGVIGDHYRPTYGVRFEDAADNKAWIHPHEPEKAHSPPNVVSNSAVLPNTSQNTPLTIWFDEPKTHVGMYIGNGGDSGLTAVLTAYDASDEVLCQTSAGPVPDPCDLFVGLHDAAGRIRKVTLDYGDTMNAEGIDDLYFAPHAPVTPTATSTATATPTATPTATATPTLSQTVPPPPAGGIYVPLIRKDV